MDAEPPHDMNDPSARVLLRQLAADAAAYARAEIAYLKADIGERASHVVPALVFYGAALALGLSLIVAIIVTITIWAGINFGFGWALLGCVIIVTLFIWGLVRAGGRLISKAMRPWQKP